MSCDNCLTSGKGLNQRLEQVKTEARNYAIQHQITMALYKDAEGAYQYIAAERSYSLGLPILQFISFNSGSATEQVD